MKVAYLKTKSVVILWDVGAIERDIRNIRLSPAVRLIPVVNLLGTYKRPATPIERADISAFPIVASFSADKYCVLVGGEQIEKARALGFKNLECYYLTPSQHKKYILDYNEEIYRRAVAEYWEDEL